MLCPDARKASVQMLGKQHADSLYRIHYPDSLLCAQRHKLLGHDTEEPLCPRASMNSQVQASSGNYLDIIV